jgi:hypothetical protein
MSALTDRIAYLVLAGHTDAHIARTLACHRATVNQVRRDLRRAGRYAPARLTAEEVPTGRVLPTAGPRQPTSEAQAASRRAALTAALTTDQGDAA